MIEAFLKYPGIPVKANDEFLNIRASSCKEPAGEETELMRKVRANAEKINSKLNGEIQ